MKSLAILGASGHGKVLADMAELIGWEKVVFFDDAWPEIEYNSHWPVIGNTSDLIARIFEFDGMIVAIGDNTIRLKKQELLVSNGAAIAQLQHPSSQISRYANIGVGTVVMAGAVVNADAKIAEACILNSNATIEHDCVIEKGVHISPNAALAGGVCVGQEAWVGIGASVRQLINIGRCSQVGAGAVVIRNVPEGVTHVGNPAKCLSKE